jgi:hypothetical protein
MIVMKPAVTSGTSQLSYIIVSVPIWTKDKLDKAEQVLSGVLALLKQTEMIGIGV